MVRLGSASGLSGVWGCSTVCAGKKENVSRPSFASTAAKSTLRRLLLSQHAREGSCVDESAPNAALAPSYSARAAIGVRKGERRLRRSLLL